VVVEQRRVLPEQIVEALARVAFHRVMEEHDVRPRHGRVELVRHAQRGRESSKVMDVAREGLLERQRAHVAPGHVEVLPIVEPAGVERSVLELLHEGIVQHGAATTTIAAA
jgi:hypothetical protein